MRQKLRHGGFGRVASLAPIGLAPLLLGVLAFSGAPDGAVSPAPAPDPAPESHPLLSDFEARVAVMNDGYARVDRWFAQEVEPVERILAPFHEDQEWVRRLAIALVREGKATGLDPRALASVVLVENPWLDPEIESFVGATGIMQVMPLHAGKWGCDSDDLTDPETNICHGSRIFEAYLRRHGDVDRALLAYNGCVRGTNTPDCHLYPSHVYSRAGRAAMQRWLHLEE